MSARRPTSRAWRCCRRSLQRRRLLALALLLPVALAPGHGPAAAAAPVITAPVISAPVTPVPAVDLHRYAGVWFEVARLPNRFQKQCVRDSLAQYTLRSDGGVNVINQCVKASGRLDQARGVARVIDRHSRARLKVSLVSVLGWRPFWGDYWIIGLDDDYRWAIVGSPDRRYGWILARTPTLAPATLETISAILARNGYRPEAFVFAPVQPATRSRQLAPEAVQREPAVEMPAQEAQPPRR